MKDFKHPEPLKEGDKIAVVAPGAGLKGWGEPALEHSLDVLRNQFGLEPEVFSCVEKSNSYLQDNPEERAKEINEAFRDDEIKGIIAAAGGIDTIKILKHLDTDVIENNPKRFYGISDSTNLSLYLWNLGIPSYYGPQLLPHFVSKNLEQGYLRKYISRSFFEESIGEITSSDQFINDYPDFGNHSKFEDLPSRESDDWEWHNRSGQVEGHVWGGCLEIVRWWLETDIFMPEESNLKDSVLLLETSGDMPSKEYVKWFLRNMGERGLLQKFSALLIGRPKIDSENGVYGAESEDYQHNQRKVIKSVVDEYCPETPVVFNLDFGHTSPTFCPKIGGKVSINCEKKSIKFIE